MILSSYLNEVVLSVNCRSTEFTQQVNTNLSQDEPNTTKRSSLAGEQAAIFGYLRFNDWKKQ